MAKKCIFCGKDAQSKNKEHVIPQWLIKHTNRTNKTILIKPDLPNFKFMSFTFPACTACNDRYAKLESAVKPILLNLMDGKSVTPEQINLLLDWFDKVRLGIWLGQLYLDKKLDEVSPHLFIDTRTGKADRMLSIEKMITNPGDKGIAFTATQTPSFENSPCAWQLIINDYVFTNASSHMLVSGHLGFPFVNKLYYQNDIMCELNVQKGKNRIINPIIKDWRPNTDSVTFYQPIFSQYNYKEQAQELYNNDYVINHCLDFTNGRGGIFYQKGNKSGIQYLTRPISVNIKPQCMDDYKFIIPALDLQDIVTKTYDCNSPTKSERDAFNMYKKFKLNQNELCRNMCKQKNAPKPGRFYFTHQNFLFLVLHDLRRVFQRHAQPSQFATADFLMPHVQMIYIQFLYHQFWHLV